MAKAKQTARKSRKPTAWSAADAAKLRKLAGKMPAAKIAKLLGRSVAAITFKAFSLRLSLRQKNSNRGRRLKVSKR